MPGGCYRFGTKAFTGSLDAKHQHTSGCFKAKLSGLRAKCIFTLIEPFLQSPHASDFTQIQRCLNILQQTTALNHLPFACDYTVYIVVVESPVVGYGINNNTFCLTTGKAAKIAYYCFQTFLCYTNLYGFFPVETL